MYYGPYGSYGEWGMGWFGGGVMMIVWIVHEVSSSKHPHSSSQALAILKERYAKGEISKEEFESKKKDILQ